MNEISRVRNCLRLFTGSASTSIYLTVCTVELIFQILLSLLYKYDLQYCKSRVAWKSRKLHVEAFVRVTFSFYSLDLRIAAARGMTHDTSCPPFFVPLLIRTPLTRHTFQVAITRDTTTKQ
jgi:hypothetical protein